MLTQIQTRLILEPVVISVGVMSEVNRFLGADGDTHMKEPPPAPVTNTESPYNTYLHCILLGSCLLFHCVKARQNADTWILSLHVQNCDAALLLQDQPEAPTWQCAIPEWDRIRPG